LIQQEELPLLRDHLLRLDDESRRDRFNGFIDQSFINSYAARCADDGTVIVAYMVDGVVRGAAELHPPGAGDSLPELAFSVENMVRRQGVGSALFRRVIEEARWAGYTHLRITTSADNYAMRALARKFGVHLTFENGEPSGTVDLIRTPAAKLAELAAAPFIASSALLSFNQTCWKLFSRIYERRAA